MTGHQPWAALRRNWSQLSYVHSHNQKQTFQVRLCASHQSVATSASLFPKLTAPTVDTSDLLLLYRAAAEASKSSSQSDFAPDPLQQYPHITAGQARVSVPSAPRDRQDQAGQEAGRSEARCPALRSGVSPLTAGRYSETFSQASSIQASP